MVTEQRLVSLKPEASEPDQNVQPQPPSITRWVALEPVVYREVIRSAMQSAEDRPLCPRVDYTAESSMGPWPILPRPPVPPSRGFTRLPRTPNSQPAAST